MPMVMPAPVMLMKLSLNCWVTMWPPFSMVSSSPESTMRRLSTAFAVSMGVTTPLTIELPWTPKNHRNGISKAITMTPPSESVTPCMGVWMAS